MSDSGPTTTIVRQCLDAIDRHNSRLKAVITPLHAQALEAAQRADAAAARGEWLGVLHGMPVSVKDSFATAGIRTTMGSALYRDHVPEHDAEVVRRLKAAGAVLVAKDNMDEFAAGQSTQNPHFGSCRNPWDTDRVPGGSSGGSAAAVAAGMTVGAVGTDAGGSVRTPAALCGISGLRPTFGRISAWNDGLPDIAEFSVAGPMARRVTDVARMFVALAGYDPRDPTSVAGPREDVLGSLFDPVVGLRIGVAVDLRAPAVDGDVAAAVQVAVTSMQQLGADVREVSVADAAEVARHFRTLRWAQGAAALASAYETSPQLLGDDIHLLITEGRAISGVDYAQAVRFRQHLRRSVEELFDQVDVVVGPTSSVTAAPVGAPAWWLPDEGSLSRISPMAGTPALSVPCGFDRSGLPIGIELLGPWWSEARLLRLGAAYQRHTDWHLRTPPGFPAPTDPGATQLAGDDS